MHLRVPVSRQIQGYTGHAQWACAYSQSCDVSSKPLCSMSRAREWSVTRLICTPLEQILATVTYRLSECVCVSVSARVCGCGVCSCVCSCSCACMCVSMCVLVSQSHVSRCKLHSCYVPVHRPSGQLLSNHSQILATPQYPHRRYRRHHLRASDPRQPRLKQPAQEEVVQVDGKNRMLMEPPGTGRLPPSPQLQPRPHSPREIQIPGRRACHLSW